MYALEKLPKAKAMDIECAKVDSHDLNAVKKQLPGRR